MDSIQNFKLGVSIMKEKLIGHIGVDAGMCWFGDPSYIMKKKDDSEPEVSYQQILKNFNYPATHKSFDFKKGHEGAGVVVRSGHGDGRYPVTAKINDRGIVESVTVTFVTD
jgi:hypothetical protein